jgi:protein TonB
MKYPFASLTASLIFWMIIFIICSLTFSKPHAFLNIDADMINIEKAIPAKQKAALRPIQKISPTPKEAEKINHDDNSKPQESPKIKNVSEKSDHGATPIYQPLPDIPADLRSEAFSTFAIAHFNIDADGSATVRLIKPCENPQLNYLLLKSLQSWKFSPARNDKGEAISSVQDIKVRFKVE